MVCNRRLTEQPSRLAFTIAAIGCWESVEGTFSVAPQYTRYRDVMARRGVEGYGHRIRQDLSNTLQANNWRNTGGFAFPRQPGSATAITRVPTSRWAASAKRTFCN